MNDIYENNIDKLKNTNIELYNKLKDIKNIDYDNVHVNDNDVVEVYVNDRWWALDSRYDSGYAVARWIEQFDDIHYKNIFIIYGLANGEYIRALSRIMGEENVIIVYEPIKEIFIDVINHVDISDILESDRILVCVNDMNNNQIEQYIKYHIDYELLDYVRVESSPNYFRLFQNEYKEFRENIDKYLVVRLSQRITHIGYGKEVGTTKIANIWEMLKGSSIDALKDVLKGNIDNIPAIIVSAGPSLDKNVDDIVVAKGKAFIISVDSAIRKLIEHNIIPDIVVTVDSHKPMVLFESDKAKEVPIVISGQSRHEIVRQHKGKRFVYTGDDFYNKLIKKWNKNISGLSTGGSVANDAFSLAKFIGFKTIILVGQDLAFTNDKKHASSVYDEKAIGEDDESCKYTYVKDNDGNDILTYINFKLYKDWFEERIASDNNIQVINATEGGARIEGAKVLTLKAAINEYCKGDLSVDITKAAPLFDKDEMENVYKEIKNFVNECDELKDRLNNGIEEYNAMERYLDNNDMISGKKLKDYIEKIDKINSAIQEDKFMEIVSLCSKPQEVKISDNIYKEDDDMSVIYNMINYSKKLLELYVDNTEMIKQMLKELIKNEIDVDIANGYLQKII